MESMKIVAMLRVKNEERWIEKSLQAASDLCDELVILDDGSTDNTIKICRNFDKVVDIHHQENLPFDESRDKNKLLNMALARRPDFILTLDGDEIIQTNARDILYPELNILYPDAPMFEFQVLTMWNKSNQYRYDGIYSDIWAKKLIRISSQPKNLFFEGTNYSGNSHCPPIPTNSKGWQESIRSKVKIFHYGNYDEELRQKKYKLYTTIDPSNRSFDGYVHIISGKGKFSGPNGIELKRLSEPLIPK